MSFNLVTAAWIARIFILYTLMVVVLPYIVMRKFLRGRSLAQKFVFCVVAGNFFYIMIVLIWGLFHITNRYVLIGTTLVIPAVMLARNGRQIWERYLKQAWIHISRFIRRENSFRYTRRIFCRWLWKTFRKLLGKVGNILRRNLLELLLFAGCSAFVVWYFTSMDCFGPKMSDIVVHIYWINGVDDGVLFREGIYPFGMHALLYYIHAVFNIPTVRVVLLFGTVQAFYIFTMFLVFLKELCRYRYTPYLSYFAFAVGNFLVTTRYTRYYSALPQEFGMIFLLPCGIALIRFFRAVREENAEYRRMQEQHLLYTRIDGKHRWRESTIQLWVLIISFGLTLSAHFYDTIIAGLLVIAAAVACIRYIFNWKTFRRLVCAAVIALVIPVLPMAAAFAGGTPLQGSLFWGLSVMGIERPGHETDADTEETDSLENGMTEAEDGTAAGGMTGAEDGAVAGRMTGAEEGTAAGGLSGAEYGSTKAVVQESVPLTERLAGYAERVKTAVVETMNYYIFPSEEIFHAWLWCMAAVIVLIPVMWVLREWEYSRYLIMLTVYSGLMILLSTSEWLGLPVLIDQDRSTIFFSYTILAALSLAADGILVVFGRIIRVKRLWQAVSFVMTGAVIFLTVSMGDVRAKDAEFPMLESNGAALCVFDIMEKYPDEKWTIISCNEERNMISPVAWHYETIDFLQGMENYRKEDEIYIPTQYVFFFIEKKSLNYGEEEFTDVDTEVSEEWASRSLPVKSGLSQYTGTNRIIVNSRMYYWAQEYRKRFPNELKVYYEDDDFICYFIEQNEYYLNNFAIDYGYNSGSGSSPGSGNSAENTDTAAEVGQNG